MVTERLRRAGGTRGAPPPLSDAALVEAFEGCSLPARQFHHEEHVRVVWFSLATRSLVQILEWFPAALRRYADSVGRPDLYHETITWVLILLIHERRRRASEASNWKTFAEANPDLFLWPAVVARYYRSGTLDSRQAREFFLLPDLLAHGAEDQVPSGEVRPPG
ncbi:MAG: hypothetical protein ABJC07_07435 [Acidobacteriota bacterium]